MKQPHRSIPLLGLALVLGIIIFSACAPEEQRADFNATETALKLEKALTQTAAASATEQAVRYPSATPTWTDAQKAAITPTAVPPTVTPTSTPGIQPPACTFPLVQTTVKESKPEKYTFSEPKIVSSSNADIEVVEWLPDSQRVLITRSIQNTSNENIELFNPQTGENHIYAVGKNPIWIEKAKSIIYRTFAYAGKNA